jgi:ketosteroid isomerase-like protein
MSEENVEIVRRLYEALGRGDLDAILELSDPDIRIYDPDLPGGGEFKGKEQAMAFLKGWREPWDDYSVEVEKMREAGDRVVALTRHRGRGKGSSVPVELADAHVWTFRDGRATHLQTFLDRAEALEAAGLSE